jgi:hypothetical protein
MIYGAFGRKASHKIEQARILMIFSGRGRFLALEASQAIPKGIQARNKFHTRKR